MSNGILAYCPFTDIWVFHSQNDTSYELCCGYQLSIKLLNNYELCRIGKSYDWFIVLDNSRFILDKDYIYDAKF